MTETAWILCPQGSLPSLATAYSAAPSPDDVKVKREAEVRQGLVRLFEGELLFRFEADAEAVAKLLMGNYWAYRVTLEVAP